MSKQNDALHLIAQAFVAGPLEEAQMLARARMLIEGTPPRWLPQMARQVAGNWTGMRPRIHQVVDEIRANEAFQQAWSKRAVRVRPALGIAPQMLPTTGAPQTWDLPPIRTPNELAATLGLHPDDLGWLTAYGQAGHYFSRRLKKRRSGALRLIESPKPLLKYAQQQTLKKILSHIPPHEAAFAFCPGKGVRDYGESHVGRDILLKLDLTDFFPSITAARVLRLFLTAGYPESVAWHLCRLCTRRTPDALLEREAWPVRERFRRPHLPQGAPTSPALANLCAFRLDCRLAGLAGAAGANYSRYADDLLFSGRREFARSIGSFSALALRIILEEGFRPNTRKTRIMPQSQSQQVAGMVLNQKPNINRREFDRLKAILTNCLRHGPESQNRACHADFRAHLLGKISWVQLLNPHRANQLRQIFDQIDWEVVREA